MPLYSQISDDIRNKIYSQELSENQKIPSESELMDKYGVSRGTVKKALKILVDEGVLKQIQGKGTYVSNSKISYALGNGLISFAESLNEQNIEYETKLLELDFRKASKTIARALKINEGDEYLYLKRIRSSNSEKIMLIENRINYKKVQGIENTDFTKDSLFKKIEEITGMKISYSESKFAAKIIGDERANLLDVSPKSPVLHLSQIVYLENNEPIEFGNVWLKSEKYYLGVMLQRR
ncbi:GntR family transcriptional regulator [Anaerococcus lactolyticus]|uniref:GntR family transcriptional regulator n=1 Tax=Anaerococcus lactolyticus TaxID=33032 RepID=UPI0023F1456C|nr:GntR family transcriptional regulator [Anaerococcus lactolyticus]